MATKRSLADLAAAFTSKTNEGGGNPTWKLFFNFWKAPVGSVSTVRFLPDADEDNPMGFLVENNTHELMINGKREKVACLKMYGEACPICELSAHFYNKNSPDHNEALGKSFYRKKSYIGQVLVFDTPVEHDSEQLVKLIDVGTQVYNAMQAAFQSGDMENPPYEFKGGYNFRFRKTLTGSGQNSYATSNFSPKETDIDDDLIASLNLYNLKDYRAPKVERHALEAMLIAAQSGGSYEEKAPASAQAPAAPAAQAAKSIAVPAVQPQTSEDAPVAPVATGKLTVVEQLRQRAAASRAAAQASE